MTVHQVTDLNVPIGELLRAAGSDGLVLKSPGQSRFAVLPLDDELIDFLIERNPKFIEICRNIRERMRAGQFQTHEQVKQLFQDE